MKYRLFVIQFALWLLISAVAVAADSSKSFEKDLKVYQKDKKDADTKMGKAFDKIAAQIRNNKSLPPETRNRHFMQIQAEKERFTKSNQLPESDDMLPATIAYLNELHDKRLKVQRTFDDALSNAIGNQPEFDRISTAKDAWQADLPSRYEFVKNTEWHGNRTFENGTTVDFHVHVFDVQNNSFEGHLWQDVFTGGKSGWVYEGMMEGNAIVLKTIKMLHGNPRTIEFRGFVIGRRLVFTAIVNGKPAKDFASVGKK